MDGTHSRRSHRKETCLRFLYENGVSTFVPTLPPLGLLTDVLLYRPYQAGESLKVDFYNDDSQLILSLPGAMTNTWHEVYLPVSGIVPIQVFGNVVALVYRYK